MPWNRDPRATFESRVSRHADRIPRVSAEIEGWLNATPDDEEYISMAYEYLDQTQAQYEAWAAAKGVYGPTNDLKRAARVAQGWKELGFSRADVETFLRASPSERQAAARAYAAGRNRRRDRSTMLPWEKALYYHTA